MEAKEAVLGDSYEDAAKYLEAAFKGELSFFTLGWGPRVDQRTFGIERENLVVVGGEYKAGKTIHSINTVMANLDMGRKVLVVPTEISKKKYIVRLAAREVGISLKAIHERRVPASEQKRLFEAVYRLRSKDLEIYDSGCPRLEDIERVVGDYGPDLLVVDHLQHLDPQDASPASGYKRITQGLKTLAVDFNIGVLLLTQVNFAEDWFKVDDFGKFQYDLTKMSTSWSKAPLAEGDKILFLHNVERSIPAYRGKGTVIYHSLRDYESGGFDVIDLNYNLQLVGELSGDQEGNPY